MYVLVCGVDSGANDALGMPPSGGRKRGRARRERFRTFLRKEAKSMTCAISTTWNRKYHALIRTSALPAADAAIALAREVKSPDHRIGDDSAGVSIVSTSQARTKDRSRGVHDVDEHFEAHITAHIAAMEVIRCRAKIERERGAGLRPIRDLRLFLEMLYFTCACVVKITIHS